MSIRVAQKVRSSPNPTRMSTPTASVITTWPKKIKSVVRRFWKDLVGCCVFYFRQGRSIYERTKVVCNQPVASVTYHRRRRFECNLESANAVDLAIVDWSMSRDEQLPQPYQTLRVLMRQLDLDPCITFDSDPAIRRRGSRLVLVQLLQENAVSRTP